MKNSLLDKGTTREQDELKHFQQKEVLTRIIDKLSAEDDSTYYLPTNQVAHIIFDIIQKKEGLNKVEAELFEGLNVEDIYILLSHKV